MRGFVLMLRPHLAEVVSTVDIDKHDGVPYAVIAVVDVLDEHGSVLERQTVELFAPTKAENTTARKMMDEGTRDPRPRRGDRPAGQRAA
ncbi:hypothetical protein SANTM175S_08413 [Streptomyces antimycoticus]